jgi:hypothetical protein
LFGKHHTFKTFGNREEDQNFVNSMKGWQTYPSKKVRDSLMGVTDGIGECIIMPAGDVFTFTGLDSDDAGAVSAQCNYANASGHEITK